MEDGKREGYVDIFVDGACRGNPGPAGLGVVFPIELHTNCYRYIGEGTNNVAEYNAVIDALLISRNLGLEKLVVHSDSQLVIKQLNAEWAVRNPELFKLWIRVYEIREYFTNVIFIQEKRKHPIIQKADKLANMALDRAGK